MSAFVCKRQISRYIDAREIMKVAEHNGKFCSIPKHGRKFKLNTAARLNTWGCGQKVGPRKDKKWDNNIV